MNIFNMRLRYFISFYRPGVRCLFGSMWKPTRYTPQKDIQTKAGLLRLKLVITFPSKCRFDIAPVLGILFSLHSLLRREQRRSFTCSLRDVIWASFFFRDAVCFWCSRVNCNGRRRKEKSVNEVDRRSENSRLVFWLPDTRSVNIAQMVLIWGANGTFAS